MGPGDEPCLEMKGNVSKRENEREEGEMGTYLPETPNITFDVARNATV